MANEKRRLIDANALMAEMKECSEGLDKYYCGYAKAFIDHAPTVDAVEFDVLESWLCQIAINSMSNPMDNNLGLVCAMIIERLDGLRKFARERREGE